MRNRIVTAVKQRFSIRKLSIGAVSVLLGTSLYFMGVSAPVVHADTNGESAVSSENGSTDIKDPVDVAKVSTNSDADVNNAIDKYADKKQGEQEKAGNKVIIRPSGKQPVNTADTVDERVNQVKDIKKQIDDGIDQANKDKETIEEYKKNHNNQQILNGRESDYFENQGLSVDDEKDSKINEITVTDGSKITHVDTTSVDGESKNIDGIDITHTGNMTPKEKNVMKVNSDNKVIVDFQPDQCQGKEITVTYDNLNNSYYLENMGDDQNNRIKISRIDRTFSNIQAADNPKLFNPNGIDSYKKDGVYDKCDGPQLIIYNDPSDGFFYNNIKQVSVKDIYYDDKGNQIIFKNGDKNKAWIFVTSLNSNGVGSNNHHSGGKEYVEKVKAENPDGTSADIEKLAGSTVTGPVDENTTKEFTRTVELFDEHSNGDYQKNYLSNNADDLKNQGWIWQRNSSELTQTVTLHVKKTNDGYVYDNADAFFKGLNLPPISENGTEKYPNIKIPEVRVGSETAVPIRVSYSANNSHTAKTLEEPDVGIDKETATDTHDGWWYSDEDNSSQNNYPDWDNNSEDNRYAFVGAVAIQYQPGMTITYGADDTAWGSHWACMQTQVVSTLNQRVIIYDHIKDGVQKVTPETPSTDIPKNTVKEAQPDQLTKKVDLTVNYVNSDGTKFTGDLPTNRSQTVTFTGTAYVDKVTGELVNAKQQADGTWVIDDKDQPQVIWTADGKDSFDEVISPLEEGYHANEAAAGGATVTPNDSNRVITVTYTKNGKIIPVDKTTGQPIQGAEQPVFPTDQKDPTKVDSGKIPDLSAMGYHPLDKDVKTDGTVAPDPKDPSRDITVEYVKTSTISVVYHDNTSDTNLSVKKTTDDEGDPFTYDSAADLATLEGEGYVLDEKDNKVPAMPTEFTDEDQIVTIHLKHGVVPVTPETPSTDIPKKPDGTTAVDPNSLTKDVDLTVNYVNSDDTAFTGKLPGNQNQTVTFTGTAYVDKVTGELVNAKQQDGTWVVDDSNKDQPQVIWTVKDSQEASFTGVTSPSEAGYEITGVEVKVGGQDAEDASAYTDGKDVKAVSDIDHNHANIDITVRYAKSTQHAKLTVIDEDNTGKDLGDYSSQGVYQEKIDFGQAPQDIDNYISKGYVWDTARNGAANYAGLKIGDYDSDPNQDQSWTIYLKHGVQQVTPETPSTDIPKKPDGTTAVDPNSLTKDVDLTVNYVNSDDTAFTGKLPGNQNQTVTFTGTAYVDKVTGELVNAKQQDGTWVVDDSNKDQPQVIWTVKDSQEASFTGVTSPSEAGYEITGVEVKVGGQDAEDASAYTDGKDVKAVSDIDHNHANIDITVRYAKSTQHAKLTVIDEDNTGKDLGDYSSQGVYQEKIDFGQAPQDIDNYISKGYVWDTARNGAANYAGLKIGDYDSDPNQDQSWTIYLKHGVQQVTPETPSTDIPKKPDGTTAVDPNSLTKDVDLTVNYVNSDDTAFTGKLPGNQNQTVTFTGTAYVDKVTGELVNAKQQDGTWVVDDSNKDQPQVIWTVKDSQEASFTGVTSPSEAGYEITGVEVKVGGQDAEDASAYTDGKDVKAVSDIDHNHANIDITVRYAKSTQHAKLTVIDEDNTGKDLGDYSSQGVYQEKIDFGQAPQDIDNYISKGYVWDTARNGAANYAGLKIGDYDSDPNQDQSWTIYLKHGVQQVTPETPSTDIPKKPDGTTAVDPNSLTKDVDLTVNYVNSDDTAFTGKLPGNQNQTVTFTGTAYVDKVTGELVNAKQQDGTWVVDDSNKDQPQVIWTVKDSQEASFTGVTSPSEAGYEITGVEVKVGGQDAEDASAYTDGKDVKAVSDIDHNHANIDITVRYAKSTQHAKLTVIDEDNTGKDLGDYSSQGVYQEKIDFGQAPQDIDNYISKGYVWDTARNGAANYAGLKIGDYDSDPNQDQSWTIYLKHGVQQVTPETPSTDIPKKPDGTTAVDPNSLTKDVDLTVNYVNSDDTAFTGKLPGNQNQTVTFTGTAYVDKVTGELVNAKQQDGTWVVDDSNKDQPQVIWTVKDSQEASFTGVTSPSEAGYEITGVEVKVGGQDAEDASAYTDGKDVKAVSDIDHNHANIDITVRYAKSTQHAKLTVIDEDNTGKDLGDYSSQGVYQEKIDFGQAPQDIDNYISKGYVWDTARNGAANYAGLKIGDYDSDPNQDQSWTIYLKHGVQQVTPETPSTDIPKKPDGTTAVDPNSLTKDVDLTVNYVNSDDTAFTGKLPGNQNQTVTFTGTAYVDKVTGELVNAKQQDGTWVVDDSNKDQPQVIWTVKDSQEASFTGVTSPSEAGYEITGVEVKVGGQDAEDASAYTDGKDVKAVSDIDHNHANIDITVRYAKSTQHAKLTVIDEDNTGKDLGDYSSQGVYQEKIDFGQAPQDIDNYISKGYVWDTARNGAANYAGLKIGDYDSDPNQDQSWTIYLKHGVQQVTPETPSTDIPKKPDGTTAVDPNSLTKDVDLTVNYVNSDDTAFTGKLPGNQNQTVTFTGTAYVDKVTGELVNAKQQDGTWVVDDSNKDQPQVIWTVKDSQEASFTGVTSPSEAGYEITGVEVKVGGQDAEDASAYTDGKDVKAVSDIDHNHANIDITVRYAKSTQHAKLTVIDEDNTGKDLGDYSSQGVYQEKIDFGQAPQDIDNYISKGYVWDTARNGAANYAGLKIGDYDSDPNQDQSWTIYLKHGVQQVTPETPSTDIPKKPDGTTAVDPNSLTKDVDLTVNYVNSDDTAFTGKLPGNQNQTVTFTGTAYVDKVTGELVNAKQQDGTWVVDDSNKDQPQVIWTVKDSQEASFTGVTSPSEAGYEITGVEVKVGGQDAEDASAYTDGKDVKAVSDIDHNHANIDITVRYAKSTQHAKLTVIDEDNTGKDLGDYSSQGVYQEKIDFGQAPQDIDNYISKGYVWDTARNGAANYAGLKIGDYDSDPNQDQSWTIYLKHGVQQVTPETPSTDIPKKPDGTTAVDPNSLTKDVDLTVNYVNSDDTAFTGKLPGNQNQTVTFTGTAYVDKVTGELVNAKQQDGTWVVDDSNKDQPQVIWTVKDSQEASFTGVTSPSEAGYEITGVEVKVGGQDAEDASAYTDGKDVKAVSDIDHNHANIDITVRYAAIPVVEQGSITVNVHDDTTDNDLQDYGKASGTQDVGTGFDYDKGSVIKSLTNAGYKVLHPEEIVIPTVITKGDQTITIHVIHTTTTVTSDNPGKPGEPVDPKNPEGPKYPNGTELDQVKRTGTQTIHYVGAGDKTPADNKQTFIFTREITFDNVTGKIISVTPWNVQSHTFGKVDTPVIPGYHADKAVTGGATVTPDDLKRVITVTYAPDGNPGNPSDHGDTPSPDDQPDSEISSDDDFENGKAKDKLDKTNPKEVAAYKKDRKIIKTKIAKQGHTEIAEPIEDKVTRENKAAEPKLPQTGEADNSIIGLLGMLLASFAAMFGFDSLHSHDKKHKN